MIYKQRDKGGLALLPFIIFIVIYLGAGIYFQHMGVEMAFYQFPSVTAMFLAVIAAFCMGDENLTFKFGIFARGAGNEKCHDHAYDLYPGWRIFLPVAAAMGGRDL